MLFLRHDVEEVELGKDKREVYNKCAYRLCNCISSSINQSTVNNVNKKKYQKSPTD